MHAQRLAQGTQLKRTTTFATHLVHVSCKEVPKAYFCMSHPYGDVYDSFVFCSLGRMCIAETGNAPDCWLRVSLTPNPNPNARSRASSCSTRTAPATRAARALRCGCSAQPTGAASCARCPTSPPACRLGLPRCACWFWPGHLGQVPGPAMFTVRSALRHGQYLTDVRVLSTSCEEVETMWPVPAMLSVDKMKAQLCFHFFAVLGHGA